MLFSAGECCVCSIAGDALFVQDRVSGRLFFLCPSCGCAWPEPPRPHEVASIDPLERFAPTGIRLPARQDIAAQGMVHLIEWEIADQEWASSLEDLLPRGDAT